MKKLPILFFVFLPILSVAQSENFELNDCVCNFEISFYNRSEADNAHDRHRNPKQNEIHIIIDDRNFVFNGHSYSTSDNMLLSLSKHQENRIYISDYYFTIGIYNSAHFYLLDELLCGLAGIDSEISSQSIVKLYLF